MESQINDSYLQYVLSSISPEHHEKVIQSHIRIGRAARALCDAYDEYNEAILERIAINRGIRHGTTKHEV